MCGHGDCEEGAFACVVWRGGIDGESVFSLRFLSAGRMPGESLMPARKEETSTRTSSQLETIRYPL